MDKKTKENLKNAFDDVEAYKDFENSNETKANKVNIMVII